LNNGKTKNRPKLFSLNPGYEQVHESFGADLGADFGVGLKLFKAFHTVMVGEKEHLF